MRYNSYVIKFTVGKHKMQGPFNIFTWLCDCHRLITAHFHHAKKKSHLLSAVIPSPFPGAWEGTDSSLAPEVTALDVACGRILEHAYFAQHRVSQACPHCGTNQCSCSIVDRFLCMESPSLVCLFMEDGHVVVSTFWLLWIMSLCTLVHTYFYGPGFFIFLGFSWEWISGLGGNPRLTLWGGVRLSSTVAIPGHTPTGKSFWGSPWK